MAASKPVVGISLGDPSGIGPEVLARALGARPVRSALVPVVFGDAGALAPFKLFRSFERCAPGSLPARIHRPLLCEVTKLPAWDRRPGVPTVSGGHAQLAYLEALVSAAKAGRVHALCTAPVSKEQISRTQKVFHGHTEYLADAFGCPVLMLMTGPTLSVALATGHVPLSQVPSLLSTEGLVNQLRLLNRSLRPLLGRLPKIAVCALNPHAGEGGYLGREEGAVLTPAIERARALGVRCSGPHPADGLFSSANPLIFDVALAMFHDQGLIATKAHDFSRTVNVTLGLPLPRTSPDHGTAYGLAGTGKASSVPMESALLKAAELAKAWPRARAARR